MADFVVPVKHIKEIRPIEDADAIEVAVIDGYQSVVQKGKFTEGQLVVYIPEQAIVPEMLLEMLNLTGRLAGKQKNRVKAIKLRKVLSQGLVLGTDMLCEYLKRTNKEMETAMDGHDLSAALDIVKYEPPIPTNFSGDLTRNDFTVKYDINNLKSYPDAFEEGELVMITEKLHGTFMGITVIPGLKDPNLPFGCVTVFSKGLGARGLVFADSEANRVKNVYVKQLYQLYENCAGFRNIVDLAREADDVTQPHATTILGEVFGRGVQDLNYGQSTPTFRLFDIHCRNPFDMFYYDSDDLSTLSDSLNIEMVPVLETVEFSAQSIQEHTKGLSTLDGHIREGIVIKPVHERRDLNGRVIYKSISEQYLLRKGGTEHN